MTTSRPPAIPAVNDDLRDTLVAISEAIANQDDRAAQAMLREILKVPQPTTPQPCSFGSPELQAMILAKCIEKDRADSVTTPAGGATSKNPLQVQVWVIPDGNGGGQFSWEKQDERYWTLLTPPAQAADSVPQALRVPLDSIHADAGYLCGRLLNGSLTQEQVVASIRRRIDAAKLAAQALSEAQVGVPAEATVNRETVIEWLDANDIEVTDRQIAGLFHAAAPQPSPTAQADSVTAPAAYSGNLEQELAMLIRRIVSSARRNCEDGSNVLKLANEAWAYLVRKGLNGSPLRDAGIESDPTPQAEETLSKEQVESLLYQYGYDPDDEHMAEMLQAAVRLKRTPHAG